MRLISPQSHSRRAFLRRAGQLAFTGAALPTALNLAALGEAAAFNAGGGDYKALVCVFLYGGNDYANTVVPYDSTSYAKYQTIRGTTGLDTANGIALARADLTPMLLAGNPTSVISETGLQYALHPSMTGLRDMYANGQMAVMLNCGPLVRPITLPEYRTHEDNTNFVPPKLFSHNDQQSVWQSTAAEGSTTGWGGHIGDLALSNNTNSLFTCMSVTGNAVFLSGDNALTYQVSTGGAVRIRALTDTTYGFSNFKDAMQQLATNTARTHLMESEYNRVTARAFNAESSITSAILPTVPASNIYPAPFNAFPGDNSLASQLRMVARLIKAQSALGTKRQVFMVSLGGFDLHDGLVADHTRNMGRVSGAIKSFYDCLSDPAFMPGSNMANQVTTFTASEFGRTLSSNGDGSDHGWGGHQFVVGGAVKGGYYGYAPPVSNTRSSAPENQWHVDQGRLLPTTSVDQIGATLATWFGVEVAELPSILPNINNFGGSLNTTSGVVNYDKNLGFML
jgi:uncharacterized protein (DUF1501 family)